MCVQKIGAVYVQDLQYGCNSIVVKIHGVTHTLDKILSYTESSCIVSNSINTFELYTPSFDLKKLKECFNCSQKVTLDNILGGVGSIINSFNSNSNNSNSTVGNTNSLNECTQPNVLNCENEKQELKIKEQLDRIESEVMIRNKRDYDIHLLILTICLIIIGIIIFLINSL